MKTSYEDRLTVTITGGKDTFYSNEKTPLCFGYLRIVIGNRGPYVECDDTQIIIKNFKLVQPWRMDSSNAFYVEYRSNDKSNVKLYHQKKVVDYADYKIGLYYLSPFDLQLENGIPLITPLHKKS